MKYLKTHFYTENEINYINLNLQESYDKVDKFIVCEFNITHTGAKRDFMFHHYEHLINPIYKDKLVYIPCDIANLAVDAKTNESLAHSTNELLMRGYFVKVYDFNDDDIIISVDCDEIIYNQCYDEIIEGVKKHGKVSIELNQFFYKLNYFWSDNNFIAPTGAYYKMYKDKYPSHWRYDGVLLSGKKGCHFSWCMTIEDMIYKLNTYAHVKYQPFANKEILGDAITRKIYPFDLGKPFTIRTVVRNSNLLPVSLMDKFYDDFWKKLS
jgi:hypothetical protein